MEQIKYVIKYIITLVGTPTDLWKYLADGSVPEADVEHVQNRFYVPLLIMSAAVILASTTFYTYNADLNHVGTDAVATGMRRMVPFIVAYYVAPFVTVVVLRELYLLAFRMSAIGRRLDVMVSYATAFLLTVEALCAAVPNLRALVLCALYLIYIVWTSSVYVQGFSEEHRWRYALFSSAVIFAVPQLVERMLLMLIR